MTQLSEDIGGIPKIIRTLVIEEDVPFQVLGKAWVFDEEAAARVHKLYREHTLRALRLVQRNRHRAVATA